MIKKKFKMTQQNIFFWSIFLLTIFVACMPLLSGNCINGHDIEYHLLRIESLKEGILMGKPFLKVNVLFFGGEGYASSLFYPDFLLYIPALLRVCGIGINLSYHIFVALCFVLGYLATYFCTKEITKSTYSASIAAVVMTLCQYHIDDVYTRSAVGEYTAFIFMPFIIYGLYDMMYGKMKKPWMMAVGFAGVLLCHTNTTVFCIGLYVVAFLFSIKKLFKNPRQLGRLVLTAVSVLILTCFYWLPVLEQLSSTTFQYVNSEFVLSNTMLEVKDIFKNANPALGIGLLILCLPRLFTHGGSFVVQDKIDKELAKITDDGPTSITVVKTDREKFADFCLVMGILFTLGTTRLIPWAYLQNILSFVQFPWRLFIVASCLLAFAIAIIFERYFSISKLKEIGMMIVLGVMITSTAASFSRNEEGYYSYSSDYYSHAPFTGNVIGGEWLPEGVTDRDSLITNADFAKDDLGNVYTVSRVKNMLNVDNVNEMAAYVDVPFVYYKGYEASDLVTAEQYRVTGEGNNGVCRVYLPEGHDELTVHVAYAGTTLQKVSSILSMVLFLAVVVVFFIRRNIMSKREKA